MNKVKRTIVLCTIFHLLLYSNIWASINDIQKGIKKDDINYSQTSSEIQLNKKVSVIPIGSTIKPQPFLSDVTIYKTITSPVTYKIIEINVNGSKKTVRVPVFNYKPLKQIKSVTTKDVKPVRINDNPNQLRRISEPIKILKEGKFTYTELPEITNVFKETTKDEGIALLNKLKVAVSNNGEVATLTYQICFKYSKYPDLCAAARLYSNEYNLSKYPLDTSFQGYPDWQENEERIKLQEMNHELKKLFDELKESYSNINDPICSAVINAVDLRLKTIEKNMEENKKKMLIYAEKLKKGIDGWDTFMKDYVSKDYPDLNSVPTKEQYQGAYNNAFGNYTELRWIYKALRDDERYSELNKNFDLRYMNMPTSVTFKYFSNGPNSDISYCTRDNIKKNFMNYTYFKKDYIDANSVFCESTLVNYDDLDKQINDIRKYVDVTHDDEENKTDNFVRKVTDQLNKSQTSPLISGYYFTGNENVRDVNRVFNANDIITLRASIAYSDYLYPIKDIQINSAVSHRSKKVNLTKCSFNYGYYGRFQPNENDDIANPKNNIINNNKDEQDNSIAIFHGAYPIGGAGSIINLYNNQYFKNKLGHSDYKDFSECSNSAQGVFRDTYSFIKSGGAERVFDQDLKNFVLVRHQAKWFVIFGHGNPYTGSIGEKDLNSSKDVIVNPSKPTAIVDGLIKSDGKSEYNEGMKVLVLAACGCLNSNHITKWHSVLPEGIILGYQGNVIVYQVSWALSELNDYINNNASNISNESIINEWEKINANLSDGQLWLFGGSLQGAVAINGPIRELNYIKFYNEVVVGSRFKVYFRHTNIYKKRNF